MKFTRNELWKIRFGLGIAQAWQDQKIEKGEDSCIKKSYLWDLICKIDDELNKPEKIPWFKRVFKLLTK